jgi:putative CocE/NonD family hydrolase
MTHFVTARCRSVLTGGVRSTTVNPSEHMVAMRDGVRLQTYLYLPEGKAPYPSALAMCQYGTGPQEKRLERFLEAGIAVVLQNIRGRFGSEGELTGTRYCGTDGYDTIQWIAAQAWSNGAVGTFGGSALARVQIDAAFLMPPAHRAMCPQVLPYGMNSRLGGAFMFSQMAQWFYFTQQGGTLHPYDHIDWMPHLEKLPVTSVLDELAESADAYRREVTNLQRASSLRTGPEAFTALDTPNLMVTGWYDHCASGPFDFRAVTQAHAPERQKRNTHLVIGPWDHSCTPEVIEEYDFGPAANVDLEALEISFFRHHLAGDASAPRPAPVRIFVMGRNQWRDEDAWPLEQAVDTRFYLHSNGEARGAVQPGALTTEAPAEERPDFFEYDPADPVPTVGGANSAPARVLPMKRGPRDQRAVLDREDVLLYMSDPVSEPLEVTGPLKLVLYAASSAPDTDFTGKLMDIAPDGNARILSDGIVRARYRNGTDQAELLTPGAAVKYEIDLWSTSNEFQTGHRIGLAVSSSNFPRFSRNLNTGGDNERESHFEVARQTILHDAGHPSHLVLPVLREG